MILTALARYEPPDAAPFGYAWKPLGFTLVIQPDGRGCHLVAHHDERGKAPEALIPNLARTVKPVPFLGCDTAAYSLGVGKPTEDEDKTAAKHDLFVELVREFARESGDERATRYLDWVKAGHPGLAAAVSQLDGPLRKRLDMDPVGIAIQGLKSSIHELPSAQAFWASRARAGKVGETKGLCLSCGQNKPTVSTLPQSLVGHLVPGATQANVALASVNFASASRGASGTGLRSAPICADCAARAVQSFNALASSKDHSWRSPAGDVGLIWWTSNPAEEEFLQMLLAPRAEWVAHLLSAPAKGAGPGASSDLEGTFYALTYSGNVARFVVRRWVELDLAEARRHVTAWFRDVESPSQTNPFFPVFRYAECLGTMRREQGRWVTPAPDGSVPALLLAAVRGEGVPRHYLALAITRAIAEVRLTTSDDHLTAILSRRRMEARVGLIRLILNRTTDKENPMAPHLDETRADPAYVHGRIFAVRESLQRLAMPRVNASIVDKFFERASRNPASVVHNLTLLSQQHLRALERDETKRGAAANIRRRLDDLGSLADDAPGRLTAEQQAAWICGYHQQRHHDLETAIAINAAKKPKAAETAEPTDTDTN